MKNIFFKNQNETEAGNNQQNPDWRGGRGRRTDKQGSSRGAGGRGQGKGFGGGNKPGSGPEGNCVCPSCAHKEPHVAGQRCKDRKCPKCGTMMMRE